MAVNELELSIAPGQLYGLIGPNGAGKTTVFNALSEPHQLEDGQQLVALRGVEGRSRMRRAKAHGAGGQAVRLVQNHEGFEDEILEADLRFFREGMAAGQDGEEFLGEKCPGVHVLGLNGQGHDGEVDVPLGELAEDAAGRVFDDLHPCLRALLRESRQDAGKVVGRDRGYRRERDSTGVGIVGHAGARVFGEAQDLVGITLEHLPGLGQPNPAAEPFEQRLAQLTFQFSDLLAERRLRYVAGLRGAGDVAEVGDLGEVAKLVHLHGGLISPFKRNRRCLWK